MNCDFICQIDIYNAMKNLLQKSIQFGGQVCRNYQLFALYYLTQGLEATYKVVKSTEKKEGSKLKVKKVR